MESSIRVDRKIKPKDAVFIEGLPGIGFVANLSAIHLIDNLKAQKFGELSSPYFQDLVIPTKDGNIRSPVHELYFSKASKNSRDTIILYGNTQALTVYGQYELCGNILDLAKNLNCNIIICIGGIKKDKIHDPPRLYCTATDHETLKEVQSYGPEIFQGEIYGVAGLLIGLAKIRGMKGFSILVETLGAAPDISAAKTILSFLKKILNLEININDVDKTAEHVTEILKSFGLIETKRREETFGPV
ncbi:MAG: uncharacterized protein QG670_1760 [Thermoproteota archaeon]|nr:uncharacterized protein [Thermoproteota archaeon]